MNRKTLSLACVFVLVLAALASAQVTGGVKAGLNIAGLSTPASDLAGVDLGSREGLVAGGFVEIPAARHVAIQPEVLFAMHGSETSVNQAGVSGTFTVALTSLDVPLLVRFDVPTRGHTVPYAYAGPNFRFILAAKANSVVIGGLPTAGQTGEQDIKDEVKTTEFGIAVGGGARFGRFLAELRYTQGLTNIVKDSVNADGAKVTNHALAIIGGVRF